VSPTGLTASRGGGGDSVFIARVRVASFASRHPRRRADVALGALPLIMGSGASSNAGRAAAVAPADVAGGGGDGEVRVPPTPTRDPARATTTLHRRSLSAQDEARLASASLRSITFEKANVNVAVRIRPLNGREEARGGDVCVEAATPQSLQVGAAAGGAAGGGRKPQTFSYDSVFPPEASQDQVYRHGARAIVHKVLEGFNGCIFAYGQTGAGKTHTMEGTASDPGVIPRLCEDIFRTSAEHRADRTFVVTMSYMEVYQEVLRDLLASDGGDASSGRSTPVPADASGAGGAGGATGAVGARRPVIREDPSTGVFVENAKCVAVASFAEVSELLAAGTKRRATGETKMNAVSSRSHAVLTLEVEQRDSDDFTGLTRMVSKLHLVDLAGSERQSAAGTTGDRLREGALINQSLSALGNVINALTEKNRPHVPYRDSKLTRLLQDSLGGNARTLMLACVSPASINRDETLSTLRFAERAKKIKNKARVNVDPAAARIAELLEENRRLAARVEELEAALASATGKPAGADAQQGGAAKAGCCAIM